MIYEHKDKTCAYWRASVFEFVLHDPRHTSATCMVEAGCTMPALAAILGDSGLRMVRRYVHPQQEHKDTAMVHHDQYLVNNRLAPAVDGPVQ